jgi:hypothetical protein
MKRYHSGLVCMTCLLLVAFFSIHQADAQQKLAQTGMKFLSVGTSARQASMAEAFTSLEGGSSSMFYNPAGMAVLGSTAEGMLGQTQWFAEIKHYYASVAVSPFDGDYGVLGLFWQYVDYGTIQSTVLASNYNGYLDVGTIHPSAYTFGIAYAKALSNKFSVGGTVKVVDQNLGEAINLMTTDTSGNVTYGRKANILDLVAFDFGVLYHTGLKSLTFGMSIRNFSREVAFNSENFQLPLSFKMGISADVLDFAHVDKELQSLLVSIDVEHPRDYPEQIRIGGEYLFAKTLAIRVGYVSPHDQNTIMYGIGLQQHIGPSFLAVDYSYVPFKDFDAVQRVTFRFSF